MTFILTHPAFGELEKPLEAFITDRGVAYVGGFWGPTRIYANLPASDLEARSTTPSVAAAALAEVATAAGHEVEKASDRIVITTDAGVLHVTWSGSTVATWRSNSAPDHRPVWLSEARRLIS